MNSRLHLFVLVTTLLWGELTSSLQAELIFNPNFDGAMTQIQKDVVNQAINDWRSVFSGVSGTSQTINFAVSLSSLGTNTLGQWSGGYSGVPFGTNVRPWTPQVTHTIEFNADRINDNTLRFDLANPISSPTFWDALSVARHEIGHMLGFTSLYDNIALNGTVTNPWTSRIVNDSFDSGNLNVAMNPGDSAHLAQGLGLLMSPGLVNNTRLPISGTEAQMLSLAYGYNIVAVPEPASLLLVGMVIPIGYFGFRRHLKRAA